MTGEQLLIAPLFAAVFASTPLAYGYPKLRVPNGQRRPNQSLKNIIYPWRPDWASLLKEQCRKCRGDAGGSGWAPKRLTVGGSAVVPPSAVTAIGI